MCYIIMYIVVDEVESVVVFVGEPVIVEEDLQVIIDCGQMIDAAIFSTEMPAPVITWYKDETPLSNGSALNVVISSDNRSCIITNTSLAVGGQFGTDGIYTCEVCADMTMINCSTNQTNVRVCSE